MNHKIQNKVVTIGIDSSSTNCGIAVFINGELSYTKLYTFSGIYSLEKLTVIVSEFQNILHNLYNNYKNIFLIIEEPINVRNHRAAMALNQVAGAICAVAILLKINVFYMHNLTAKKAFKVKTKEDTIKAMRNIYPKELVNASEHECDAVLLVESYKKLYVTS